MMPTKKRLVREAVKRQAEEEIDAVLGEIPEWARLEQGDAEYWGAYPNGLVQIDEMTGEPYLHENIGKGGNEGRACDKDSEILNIENKFAHYIGKPGAAKRIEDEYEPKPGKKLTLRTIQRYLRDIKQKRQAK
jgi:hypothetical protein